MPESMTVAVVSALLRPMFAEMLRPDELRSLRFRIGLHRGAPLRPG